MKLFKLSAAAVSALVLSSCVAEGPAPIVASFASPYVEEPVMVEEAVDYTVLINESMKFLTSSRHSLLAESHGVFVQQFPEGGSPCDDGRYIAIDSLSITYTEYSNYDTNSTFYDFYDCERKGVYFDGAVLSNVSLTPDNSGGLGGSKKIEGFSLLGFEYTSRDTSLFLLGTAEYESTQVNGPGYACHPHEVITYSNEHYENSRIGQVQVGLLDRTVTTREFTRLSGCFDNTSLSIEASGKAFLLDSQQQVTASLSASIEILDESKKSTNYGTLLITTDTIDSIAVELLQGTTDQVYVTVTVDGVTTSYNDVLDFNLGN